MFAHPESASAVPRPTSCRCQKVPKPRGLTTLQKDSSVFHKQGRSYQNNGLLGFYDFFSTKPKWCHKMFSKMPTKGNSRFWAERCLSVCLFVTFVASLAGFNWSFLRSLQKFEQQNPIWAERWRRKARRWENPKMYPLELYPGPTIPATRPRRP